MKKFTNAQLSAIMHQAWILKKENADNLFSLCLKSAWADFKAGKLVIESTPESIIKEWKDIEVQKQITLVTACLKKVSKDIIGYSKGDEYNQINEHYLWECFGASLQELVNSCFVDVLEYLQIDKIISINKRRSTQGKQNISLVSLVYMACKRGLMNLYRNEIKHVKAAYVQEWTNDNGLTISILDLQADVNANYDIADNGIMLNDFMSQLTKLDNDIFKSVIVGYTERQIADAYNLSKTAIHYRIEKIRNKYREYMTINA